MSTLPVTNPTGVPQMLGETWIAPGATAAVPLDVCVRLRDVPHVRIDWSGASEAFVPSFRDGRLAGLALHIPLSVYDGYGWVGYLFLGELDRRGVATDLSSHWVNVPGAEGEALKSRCRAPRRHFELGVGVGPPDVHEHLACARSVNYSMWEATSLPAEWVARLNRQALVIVPCSQNAAMYRESGVTAPIAQAPCPIDTAFWSERTASPDPDGPFTVVSWSRMSGRKMPYEMVRCFQAAFPRERYPDVRFELKTVQGLFGAGYNLIPHVADDRIRIHNGYWTPEQLRGWVGRAHAAFFLSRGEGMFNPPMQAMAQGIPTILPDHSGPADFASPRWCYPVGLDRATPTVPAPEASLYAGLEWFNPDLDEAVAHLRAVYDDYAAAKKRAARAPAVMRARYNPETCAGQLVAAIEGLGEA